MSIRLSSGAMVGKYRIDGLLAEGGMGVVYRARQTDLDLPVALKVIRPEWAHDDDFRARFKREARLAASLHHPHVVSPHDFGDHDGQLFVVMPLIPGIDLGTVIERDGPLTPPRAADVIAQVAAALDVAHASGLVHRDVKPANVLLVPRDGGEHAYLTDFGVAKAISSETKITRLGQLPGTPGYVSPEQINGDPLDARTDVYSLGCVLCETLTGSVPYPRQTPAAMLIAHMTDAPPRVSQRVPGAPEGFDAVVGRALAKEPAERYGSAGELAQAAVAAAADAEAPARRAPRSLRKPAAAPEPGPATARRERRRPARAAGSIAIVVAAALGALGGAWATYRIGSADEFDVYRYGYRVAAFAAAGAVFTGLLAVAVEATRSARSVPLLLTAAAGVWVGVLGGALAALPYGWDGSPRRYLITIWLLTGLAAGIGVTVTRRARRTVLLAALFGALGGAAGALTAWTSLGSDDALGNSGLGPFALAEMIAGTGIGLGIALALHLARRFVAAPDDSGPPPDIGVASLRL